MPTTKTEDVKPLKTGLQFASEIVIPGGSNLINGDLGQGVLHLGLGVLAKSVFGLPGLLIVAANSFTKASTGHHIYEALGGRPADKPSS
ncbi:MAG TPA: DUF6072 family protein [Pyrinomonadaceae bacterium]|nr:DUF6072 family protein [Pyrinomonadaceae bacterium]